MNPGLRSFLGLSRDATTIWRSSLFAVRLVALVMASVAFAAVLFVTEPPGPGLEESSGQYLGAARSLAEGHGLRVPTANWVSSDSESTLTRYAPGYPVALAVPIAGGFPAVQAARLVGALSAFVTMAVLLSVIGDAVGAGAALALGIALLVTPALVDVHLSVLSEPLFLACIALTLATMVAMPDVPVAAGAWGAAALMVSYTGIGIVLGVVVWALSGGRGTRPRWTRAALAALPTAVVCAAGALLTHGLRAAVGRRLGVYSGLGGALSGAGRTLTLWLVPTDQRVAWGWWLAIPLGAALVALLVAGGRRAFRLRKLLPDVLPLQSSTTVPQLIAARILSAAAALAAGYMITLIAARVFADAYATYDYRLLSPVILIASAACAVSAATWWRSAPRAGRLALGVLLAGWGAAAGAASWRHARQALDYGLDYAQQDWDTSKLVEWARNEGARHPLYSNWPMLGYVHLERPVRGLPPASDSAALRAFADTLAARDGVILAVDAPNPRFVSPDALVRVLGFRVLASYPNGEVLAAPVR